jgi:hypothetical protein
MASILSKTGMADGSLITAAQLTQSIDAFTAAHAYNIYISGSVLHTGSFEVTGTASADYLSTPQGNINALTSSYSISSSYSVTSSHAITSVTASHALSGTGSFAGNLSGTLTTTAGYITLTNVSESLHYNTDAAAGVGGVPLGGLYRSGSLIKIRMS